MQLLMRILEGVRIPFLARRLVLLVIFNAVTIKLLAVTDVKVTGIGLLSFPRIMSIPDEVMISDIKRGCLLVVLNNDVILDCRFTVG